MFWIWVFCRWVQGMWDVLLWAIWRFIFHDWTDMEWRVVEGCSVQRVFSCRIFAFFSSFFMSSWKCILWRLSLEKVIVSLGPTHEPIFALLNRNGLCCLTRSISCLTILRSFQKRSQIVYVTILNSLRFFILGYLNLLIHKMKLIIYLCLL